MIPEEKKAELERLNRLLAAREGKLGYRENCDEIRHRIAEIGKR